MRIQLPTPRRPPPEPAPEAPHLLPYLINPCDQERHRWLAPVGDAAAALWHAFVGNTVCPCCLGFRLLALTLVAAALAVTVTLLVT